MLNFNEFQASTKKTHTTTSNIALQKDTSVPIDEKEKNHSTENILRANPSQMIISKSQFAKTLGIVGLISGAIMFAVGKNKKFHIEEYKKLLNDAQQNLAEANGNIQDLTSKNQEQAEILKNLEKTIAELQKKLEKHSEPSKETKETIETKIAQYKKLVSETTTIYEDAKLPEAANIRTYALVHKKIPFARQTTLPAQKEGNSFIQNLLNKFNTEGRIEIPLNHKSADIENIQKAKIKEKSFSEIGIPQKTNILTNYGKSANWSDEKIARDIIQNFYDGNGHSLDDIGFLVEKLPNGNFKIKISGNGVFDHEKLMFLGSTTKDGNPYDAGGFGEGIKIISACMINKGHTQNLRFGSADWELVFDESENVVRTTLNKTNQILDGNYIEFETPNENFAKKIISALDYFKHSKNSDFNNLTFENDEFGFRILPKGQKGNFYLTQRFEYGQQGAWEGGVEGLDIAFKRKPDGKTYKELTKHNFDTGRDRTTMSEQDIFDLTRCFAKNMQDEEILDCILKTQEHWYGLSDKGKNTAIKSFIKALNAEAAERRIGFDFSGEKICCYDYGTNETVIETVKNAGYKIIMTDKCNFYEIGMPQAIDVFKSLSNHKALAPTEKEAKKLKVLEEATAVIQKAFMETYVAKLNDIFSKIDKKDLKLSDIRYQATKMLCELDDFIIDESIADKTKKYIIIHDKEKFEDALYDYLSRKIKSINANNINDKDNEKAIQLILQVLKDNEKENELFKQFFTQLSNLQIIKKEDVTAPRFIFDRNNEIAKTTLGEAIIRNREYKGHWIDRTYLRKGKFYDLLATWMHEITHKAGGDGTAQFTYKLTDIIAAILQALSESADLQTALFALEKVFNEI